MKIKTTILTLVALLFAFEGVAQQVELPKGRNLNFGLQAHRGLSHRYPENTVLAFKEAGKVPYFYGMETDVQMTKDGVLVCMHDKTIDRTTNGTGKVSDYTWKELKKFYIDAGCKMWDKKFENKYHVATFKQYVKICKKEVSIMETKVCTKCGKELPLDQFNWRDKKKGTRRADCKDCHNGYMKNQYQQKINVYTFLQFLYFHQVF
mgnify:CR=1 FL=1